MLDPFFLIFFYPQQESYPMHPVSHELEPILIGGGNPDGADISGVDLGVLGRPFITLVQDAKER